MEDAAINLLRLSTPRMLLRPWQMADWPMFHRIWGDPRVIWWADAHGAHISQARLGTILRQCATMPPGLGWWAALPAEGSGVLGGFILRPAPYDDSVELGYHLAHAAWGRGLATEGAAALLRHGFATLALPRITAVVHADNAPSHAVVKRLGMRALGPMAFHGLPHVKYALNHAEAAAYL